MQQRKSEEPVSHYQETLAETMTSEPEAWVGVVVVVMVVVYQLSKTHY